jgi:hypothetical protein
MRLSDLVSEAEKWGLDDVEVQVHGRDVEIDGLHQGILALAFVR